MSSGSPPFLSLVVPTYNEHENLPGLLARLADSLDQALGESYEIIVVDDDSPDETWRIATELAASMPRLRVIRRKERGLATAVVDGWKAARGEALGVIDADLQHPPEVLLKLIEAIREGADLALASRHVQGGGLSDWHAGRRVISRGAQLMALLLLPEAHRVADPMSGYFIVRRDTIDPAELRPLGYKILLEVLVRGHLTKITEVGYVFQERRQGGSKVTPRVYAEYLVHLWRLWRKKRRANK